MSNASENAILRSAPDSTTAITSAKGDVIGSFRYHCWPWSKQFEIFSLQNEFLPYNSLVRLMAIIAASSSQSAPIQAMFQIFAITPCAPEVQGATNNQPSPYFNSSGSCILGGRPLCLEWASVGIEIA